MLNRTLGIGQFNKAVEGKTWTNGPKNEQTVLTPYSLCDKVLTPPNGSASNSPQTQWVAKVAQAVAIATMTS